MLLDPRRGHVDVEATDAKGRTALFYCINLHDLRPLPSEHHKTMRTVTGLLKQRQRGRPESRDHVRAARRHNEGERARAAGPTTERERSACSLGTSVFL